MSNVAPRSRQLSFDERIEDQGPGDGSNVGYYVTIDREEGS
jgi:hypothetical protein